MFNFFYQISLIFSRFLIMMWLHYVWFHYYFCNEILTHSICSVVILLDCYQYIYTILESQFMDNLELFRTKKNSGFYPKYYKWYSVWCFHEWTVKTWKYLTMQCLLVGIYRTWSYFTLCLSFSCSGYDLTIIKKEPRIKLLL